MALKKVDLWPLNEETRAKVIVDVTDPDFYINRMVSIIICDKHMIFLKRVIL